MKSTECSAGSKNMQLPMHCIINPDRLLPAYIKSHSVCKPRST